MNSILPFPTKQTVSFFSRENAVNGQMAFVTVGSNAVTGTVGHINNTGISWTNNIVYGGTLVYETT